MAHRSGCGVAPDGQKVRNDLDREEAGPRRRCCRSTDTEWSIGTNRQVGKIWPIRMFVAIAPWNFAVCRITAIGAQLEAAASLEIAQVARKNGKPRQWRNLTLARRRPNRILRKIIAAGRQLVGTKQRVERKRT
jgi:hypothetical protein